MTESISSDIKQEANAALLEVDKGLKSSQPGDQCEAIVRFPSLMDQYPFPVLINVAFLKLADVFRTGSNLLRLNILRVVSVTQKHLNKITSSNEFFRRIYSVIHSNDPVARALTLKFFASISKIISERKSVHHCIWKGLESHDQVEVEAAIIATDALCCYSSTFAAGVYEKITGIILGLKTPPEMKIKVIPVLKRINHTLAIASQVKDVCLQLLESHPSLSFVSVILPTLTDLAISTLVLANEQISLLMDYAQNDPRKSIRQNALRGLYSLSVKAPQCWDGDIIKKLVQLVIETSYHNEKVIGCKIIYKLSLSLAIVHHMSHITGDLKSLCLLKSTVASAYAISARCNINMAASDQYNYNNMNTMEEIIELLVVHLTTNERSQANSEVIKVLLSSLSKASINCTIKEELLELLISQLPILPDDCHSALCNTVTVIVSGCNERQASLYPSVTQHLIQFFKSNPTLVPLSIMLLEIHKGSYTSPQYESFMTNVQPLLRVHLTNQQSHDRYWQAYKIARESTKLGFHSFAGSIYNNLYHLMTDIKYRQWLQILHLFSEAQCIIASSLHNVNDLVISLQSASSILYKCSLLVKGTGQSSAIHCQFLPCLASLCDCYSQLLSLCISHKVLLPPDNLSNKFKCIINQLHSIGKRFSNLLRSLFDSDPSTLNYIKLLHQSCTLLANVMSFLLFSHKSHIGSAPSITTPTSPFLPISLDNIDNFSTDYVLGRVCNHILSKAQSLSSTGLSVEHLNAIESDVLSLVKVPFLLPPSFFVSYQCTKVQLVVSPTSLTSGQPITIKTGTHLALKVEGVIEHSGKKIFRSPTSVNIIVTPKVNELADNLIKMPQLSDLQLTPPIVNDYFVGEFLLTLPRVGTYVVAIETNLVDGESKIWHTGPQIETNVKVESDDDIKPASTTTNNIKGPTNTTTATTSGTTNGNSTW